MTIPSHSDATAIRSIYVDIAKKVTDNKSSQFKKSQAVPKKELNESRG